MISGISDSNASDGLDPATRKVQFTTVDCEI